MSADNWGICPRCKATNDSEHEKLIEQLRDGYGKISEAEYIALRKRVSDKPKLVETLREDYEIFTDEDGKFTVDYGCSCSKCGFSHAHSYSEQVFSKGKNA